MQAGANEPVARVPKMLREKISMGRGIDCCHNFFIFNFLPDSPLHIVHNVYVYTYLRTDCIWIIVATK